MTRLQTKKIKKVAKKHNLKLVYLFGSSARGDTHKHSDVDVAYLADSPLDYKTETRLREALRSSLITAGKPLDLVDIFTAPPLLGYMIAREGKKIYGAKKDDDRFYRYAMQRYIDAKPLFDLTKQYVRSQIRF